MQRYCFVDAGSTTPIVSQGDVSDTDKDMPVLEPVSSLPPQRAECPGSPAEVLGAFSDRLTGRCDRLIARQRAMNARARVVLDERVRLQRELALLQQRQLQHQQQQQLPSRQHLPGCRHPGLRPPLRLHRGLRPRRRPRSWIA